MQLILCHFTKFTALIANSNLMNKFHLLFDVNEIKCILIESFLPEKCVPMKAPCDFSIPSYRYRRCNKRATFFYLRCIYNMNVRRPRACLLLPSLRYFALEFLHYMKDIQSAVTKQLEHPHGKITCRGTTKVGDNVGARIFT